MECGGPIIPRERGLNISQICEKALIQAVQNKGSIGTVGSPMVRPPGFELQIQFPLSNIRLIFEFCLVFILFSLKYYSITY